jgi:hypothetical protein
MSDSATGNDTRRDSCRPIAARISSEMWVCVIEELLSWLGQERVAVELPWINVLLPG